ncbi:MAG TPA: Holliday junction branch migration protein RuvA [archaeon]|nr:Holliday junction branch migration protein RuvA [archaeon]
MIALLEGKIFEKSPASVVIFAGGVGYLVSIPLSTFDKLPEAGEIVSLHTHLHVRDDALQLYGFSSRKERQAFEKLITVNGVGPRVALAILSSLSVERLVTAVESSQTVWFNRIPGVGKKTADRIILELKGKLGEIAPIAEAASAGALPGEGEEAVAALVALGYSRLQAEKAVFRAVEEAGERIDTTDLVRRALARM